MYSSERSNTISCYRWKCPGSRSLLTVEAAREPRQDAFRVFFTQSRVTLGKAPRLGGHEPQTPQCNLPLGTAVLSADAAWPSAPYLPLLLPPDSGVCLPSWCHKRHLCSKRLSESLPRTPGFCNTCWLGISWSLGGYSVGSPLSQVPWCLHPTRTQSCFPSPVSAGDSPDSHLPSQAAGCQSSSSHCSRGELSWTTFRINFTTSIPLADPPWPHSHICSGFSSSLHSLVCS